VKVLIYKYKEKRKYLDKNKIYNLNGQIIIFTNDLEELRKLQKFVFIENLENFFTYKKKKII
jgi:hypothetical protein